MRTLCAVLVILLISYIPATAAGKKPGDLISLVPVLSDIRQPTQITHAGDETGRLFVLEQQGRVIVLNGLSFNSRKVFLDITGRVGCCGERGLLGLAFPPGPLKGKYVFVNYTDSGGDTVIARFKIGPGPDRADPESEKVLLRIEQPYSNHNGGQIAFGPDGYLYVGTGDGGAGGDPLGSGQGFDTLLGKLLRLDVSPVEGGYKIPGDNPFAGKKGHRPEIWALGLRNPWRFSFDRLTGDLYIADVGQNKYEEINMEPAGSPGGLNYGWNIMEGMHCFKSKKCDRGSFIQPILEYSHSEGCSVTGGMVYRGPGNRKLSGKYVYGDYCSGRIWGARKISGAWSAELLADTKLMISTFGEDEQGRFYVADYKSGIIYRIESR